MRIIKRLEAVCVLLATTAASGTFHNINEWITRALNLPIPMDKIGVFADLGAGSIALWHHLHHKRHKEAEPG